MHLIQYISLSRMPNGKQNQNLLMQTNYYYYVFINIQTAYLAWYSNVWIVYSMHIAHNHLSKQTNIPTLRSRSNDFQINPHHCCFYFYLDSFHRERSSAFKRIMYFINNNIRLWRRLYCLIWHWIFFAVKTKIVYQIIWWILRWISNFFVISWLERILMNFPAF